MTDLKHWNAFALSNRPNVRLKMQIASLLTVLLDSSYWFLRCSIGASIRPQYHTQRILHKRHAGVRYVQSYTYTNQYRYLCLKVADSGKCCPETTNKVKEVCFSEIVIDSLSSIITATHKLSEHLSKYYSQNYPLFVRKKLFDKWVSHKLPISLSCSSNFHLASLRYR